MNNIPRQLYPSILTESVTEAHEQLAVLRTLPHIQTVQLDVIDGFFADNLTITPDDLANADFGDLTLDLHLMVNEPMDFVLEAVALKENLPIRAVIAQVERMSSQAEYLEEVKRQGWLPGLSLDLHTPLEAIDDSSWSELKVLQFMGNHAGYRGQPFVPAVLEKVHEARELVTAQHLEIELVMDVGVRVTNFAEMKAAVADSAVVGGELWKAEDMSGLIEQYYQILSQ